MVDSAAESESTREAIRFMFQGELASYVWDPCDDITVAELSEFVAILPAAIYASFKAVPFRTVDALIHSASDGLKRHIKAKQKSGIVLPARVNGN